MPRPDLTQQRSTQILDAFERCVVRSGLAATSLEHVAEEAGVQRSIIRHYIGNRDEVVRAMARRVVERLRTQQNDLMEWLESEGHGVDRLLRELFGSSTPESLADVVLIESLIGIAEADVEIRELMSSVVADSVDMIRTQLRKEYPDAKPKRLWSVAYGVVSIYYNHESLGPLQLPAKYERAAIESARALIASLD